MKMSYMPVGICAKEIIFELEGTKIKDVTFVGGCVGSHNGIVSLAKGMEINDVIERLKGITCGRRDTSCPDQLAKALIEYSTSSN